MKLWTIGGYGTNPGSFFQALTNASVEVLLDTRRRAGMRGARYAFLNKEKLTEGCDNHGIAYKHEKDLAPTKETRDIQARYDREHRQQKYARTGLCAEFVNAYRQETLGQQKGLKVFKSAIERTPHSNPVKGVAIFCVERIPSSCHRSLLAEYLSEQLDCEYAGDLTP